jgi:hypothetical protein
MKTVSIRDAKNRLLELARELRFEPGPNPDHGFPG